MKNVQAFLLNGSIAGERLFSYLTLGYERRKVLGSAAERNSSLVGCTNCTVAAVLHVR